MFYYLLYNSSFSFIVDNRLFTTVLYGSILYILTHAILNYCKVEVLEIINNYFWFIFILDVASLAYGVYHTLTLATGTADATQSANLDVSFNLLKNQINTISGFFNKKNDISISIADATPVPTPTPRAPLRIPTSPTSSYASAPMPIPHPTQPNHNLNKATPTRSSYSTPITALRNGNGHGNGNDLNPPSRHTTGGQIPHPVIDEEMDSKADDGFGGFSDLGNLVDGNNPSCSSEGRGGGRAESVAGSDVGSIMDLDDFERSL